MFIQTLYLNIFLYNLVIRPSVSWRPFTFTIEKFSTQSFSKVFDINSTLTNNEITLYANVRENLPNFFSNTVVKFESANGIYDMVMVNRTIDYCRLFRDKRYEPVLQLFYKLFTSKSDIAHSCPIKKKLYSLTNCSLDAENFPPVMPNKRGFIDSTISVKYGKEMKPVGQTTLYFEFKNANIRVGQ